MYAEGQFVKLSHQMHHFSKRKPCDTTLVSLFLLQKLHANKFIASHCCIELAADVISAFVYNLSRNSDLHEHESRRTCRNCAKKQRHFIFSLEIKAGTSPPSNISSKVTCSPCRVVVFLQLTCLFLSPRSVRPLVREN